MRRNTIETVMGAVVMVIAAVFLVFAYTSANLGAVEGYQVSARFTNAGGLQNGADVRISGVKVGTVLDLALDPASYLAVVHMSIDPAIRLPTDTVAVVASESLLGGKYMALEPGAAEETIPPGGTIEFTQSTPGLEQLLGQVIYNLQGLGESAPAGGAGADGAAPGGGASAAPGGLLGN